MHSSYKQMIAEDAPGYEPEAVECYMRLKLGTLEHLTRDSFRIEMLEAVACVNADPRLARRLVRTYGPTSLFGR
ncbi:MAG TPA: hypothetical protein VG757_05140 [Devosia sp.]|nr:hypothetical protein [Devosia sp.]